MRRRRGSFAFAARTRSTGSWHPNVSSGSRTHSAQVSKLPSGSPRVRPAVFCRPQRQIVRAAASSSARRARMSVRKPGGTAEVSGSSHCGSRKNLQEPARQVLRYRQSVSGHRDERGAVQRDRLRAAHDTHAGRPLRQHARQRVRAQRGRIEIVQEYRRAGLDQRRHQSLVEFLLVVAGRERRRRTAERDQADRPHQQPLAAAGARHLRRDNQRAGREPKAGPAAGGQKRGMERALRGGGRLGGVHNHDPAARHQGRFGKRESAECVAHKLECGVRLGACRPGWHRKVGQRLAPHCMRSVVASTNQNAAVRRQQRRRGHAGQRGQAPLAKVKQHPCHGFRQCNRHSVAIGGELDRLAVQVRLDDDVVVGQLARHRRTATRRPNQPDQDTTTVKQIAALREHLEHGPNCLRTISLVHY